LVADGREGINGLTLANAMFLSSWTNAPVTMPLDEQKFYDMLMERCKTSRHKEETGKTFSTEGSY
ncbi:MAG: gfo/Idh/MocA family oxidoreductase, partial [Clostridia bacterium]|nr:gfo/Idh/MocA family oxidoreductase [Clostridia bacterium]